MGVLAGGLQFLVRLAGEVQRVRLWSGLNHFARGWVSTGRDHIPGVRQLVGGGCCNCRRILGSWVGLPCHHVGHADCGRAGVLHRCVNLGLGLLGFGFGACVDSAAKRASCGHHVLGADRVGHVLAGCGVGHFGQVLLRRTACKGPSATTQNATDRALHQALAHHATHRGLWCQHARINGGLVTCESLLRALRALGGKFLAESFGHAGGHAIHGIARCLASDHALDRASTCGQRAQATTQHLLHGACAAIALGLCRQCCGVLFAHALLTGIVEGLFVLRTLHGTHALRCSHANVGLKTKVGCFLDGLLSGIGGQKCLFAHARSLGRTGQLEALGQLAKSHGGKRTHALGDHLARLVPQHAHVRLGFFQCVAACLCGLDALLAVPCHGFGLVALEVLQHLASGTQTARHHVVGTHHIRYGLESPCHTLAKCQANITHGARHAALGYGGLGLHLHEALHYGVIVEGVRCLNGVRFFRCHVFSRSTSKDDFLNLRFLLSWQRHKPRHASDGIRCCGVAGLNGSKSSVFGRLNFLHALKLLRRTICGGFPGWRVCWRYIGWFFNCGRPWFCLRVLRGRIRWGGLRWLAGLLEHCNGLRVISTCIFQGS